MSESHPSIALGSLVYDVEPRWDDPAETYHEASRLHPSTALARLPGLELLAREPALVESTRRAARGHPHRPGVELARPRPLRRSLGTALARRRSRLTERGRPLSSELLATLLAAAYGSDADGRRRVPSGGALYPLELYVVPVAVAGIERALLHYDPYPHRLARLGEVADDELADALVDPTLLERTHCVVVLTAVFWRARFKYGQRAYRFTLLEAGHVAQNLLLAAAALGISALPLGGFYDARLDSLLGIDGVDESSLYLILLGGPA